MEYVGFLVAIGIVGNVLCSRAKRRGVEMLGEGFVKVSEGVYDVVPNIWEYLGVDYVHYS